MNLLASISTYHQNSIHFANESSPDFGIVKQVVLWLLAAVAEVILWLTKSWLLSVSRLWLSESGLWWPIAGLRLPIAMLWIPLARRIAGIGRIAGLRLASVVLLVWI